MAQRDITPAVSATSLCHASRGKKGGGLKFKADESEFLAKISSAASIRERLLLGVCPQRERCDWDLLAFADASCAGPGCLAPGLLRGVCPQRERCDRDLLAFADTPCARPGVPGTWDNQKIFSWLGR